MYGAWNIRGNLSVGTGEEVSRKKSEAFEDALKRLQQIVEKLEQGNLPLEEAIQAFTEGMQLVHFCTCKLEEAEKKVEMLVKNQQGEWVSSPFEPDIKDIASNST